MKLLLNGNVNVYYIQTLCMIFFPGEKFGQQESEDPNAPVLRLSLRQTEEGMEASVEVSYFGKNVSAVRVCPMTSHHDADKTAKRRLIFDYSGVILYVCRRGNRFCNQRDILNAACLISITLLYEGVDEGDGIDHLALRIHTKERRINVLMLLKVEVVRADHTAHVVKAFGLD